ncbi:hypothetical protein HK100_011045 [Physocladia obscura]|uniref:Methyltransferase domain-containing protein n=1 Tax=Physocladia obscura TaxID=109957 RepID=A0AAD5T1Z6_9FUNG|nr:hypothetical protein HK100_011045 [Physocladia obscura]
MGCHQSKIIKIPQNEIFHKEPEPARLHADSGYRNADPAKLQPLNATPQLQQLDIIKATTSSNIDHLQAKVWNPNNPASWEPEMRGYHSVEGSNYPLPSDEIEQHRLETQHYILRAIYQGDIVCPQTKDLIQKAGAKVLDVGCAKGFWLESVRKDYPLAEYHGVDIAETLATETTEYGKINIKFGNVLERLPYDDSTFDYTHQRLIVLGMPKDRFPDALRELIRVTKPGGWIEVVEADAVIYKAGPYSKKFSNALLGAMHARGLDCYAATNLEWYAKEVAANISNQGIKTVHAFHNDNTQLGTLSAKNGKTAFFGMEDWMHKSIGCTREEYRELVENCVAEWAEYKSFWQGCALYFQVKK